MSFQFIFPPRERLPFRVGSVCMKGKSDPMVYPANRINQSESDEELRQLRDAKISVEKANRLNQQQVKLINQPILRPVLTQIGPQQIGPQLARTHQPVVGSLTPIKEEISFSGLSQGAASYSRVYAPLTSRWLREHFEEENGASIPRGAMYDCYLKHFDKIGLEPCNPAMFGKVVRSVFCDLTTRRLGTRGHSKYHYYGLKAIDSDFIGPFDYPDPEPPDTPVTPEKPIPLIGLHTIPSFPEPKDTKPNLTLQKKNSEEIENLLIYFPKYENFDIPPDYRECMENFSNLYRVHAVNFLFLLSAWDSSNVKNVINTFWTSVLSNRKYANLLTDTHVLKYIEECNKHINKASSSILVPGLFQPLTDSRKEFIKEFATSYPDWIEECQPLTLHKQLLSVMVSLAKKTKNDIIRQTYISEMASGAREIFHDYDAVQCLLDDWKRLDTAYIKFQCKHICTEDELSTFHFRIEEYMTEFQKLLSQQTTFHQYMDWLKSIAASCLHEDASLSCAGVKDRSRNFILKMNYVINTLGRELLYLNTGNIGNFHLLEILFRDYILYILESGEDLPLPTPVTLKGTGIPSLDEETDILMSIFSEDNMDS